MLAVPPSAAPAVPLPALIASAIAPVKVLSMWPKPSSARTTGCVGNATLEVESLGETLNTSRSAVILKAELSPVALLFSAPLAAAKHELQRDGLSHSEIVRFTSELIELMSMNDKTCSCGETPCICER